MKNKNLEKIKDSIKKKDGWWASIFSGKIANLFLYFICDIKWLTPNIITTFSLVVCIFACYLIFNGNEDIPWLSAILIQFAFILDCLDGQLARYRDMKSNFGAWYDRVTDRIKDFLIYFSIAFGHYKLYDDWVIWPLAMCALFFVYLFDYYVNQDIKLLPLNIENNKNSKKSILNKLFSFGSRIYKSIPILQFHIGEQYLLISLFVFFNQTRLYLIFVIVLGLFYSFYWPVSTLYGKKPVSD